MEELEAIIMQVIDSVFANRMSEEDAHIVLINACKIAMNAHTNVQPITTNPVMYQTETLKPDNVMCGADFLKPADIGRDLSYNKEG